MKIDSFDISVLVAAVVEGHPHHARAIAWFDDRKPLEGALRFRAMTASIYRESPRRSAVRNLRSGASFDALHLVAAREDGADAIVTFNHRDFERLWEQGDPAIIVPPDPTGLPEGW